VGTILREYNGMRQKRAMFSSSLLDELKGN